MRDALVVLSVGAVMAVVGAGIYIYFTTTTPAPVQTPVAQLVYVPFTEITKGQRSKVTERTNYLITSSVEFNELWKLVDAPGQPPIVNFDENNIIAVFAGEEPNAGYAIEVAHVGDADSRVVAVTLTKPGGSCLLAKKLTQPYQIIELPKTTLPLTHEDETITESCLQ